MKNRSLYPKREWELKNGKSISAKKSREDITKVNYDLIIKDIKAELTAFKDEFVSGIKENIRKELDTAFKREFSKRSKGAAVSMPEEPVVKTFKKTVLRRKA